MAAAQAAFPGWRATSHQPAHRDHVPHPEPGRAASRGDRGAPDRASTARSAPTRWARSPAASRTSSSRPASRTCSRAASASRSAPAIDVYQIRQPLGVVAGITPFNFPAMVPMWMFANAIACGNTFILKPSEKDPSASVYLAELLKEAGLPDGVFNVVHGDKVAVDRDPRASRTSPPCQLRRLDADRALHLRDRHGARQARAGAGRRQEPHGRAARRRHRDGRRCRRLRRLRLGRRALHGDQRGRGGRRRRRSARRGHRGAAAEDQGRAGQRGGLGDGPARHEGAPRQGRHLPRHAAPRRAPRCASTAASTSSTARARASSSASRCSTT